MTENIMRTLYECIDKEKLEKTGWTVITATLHNSKEHFAKLINLETKEETLLTNGIKELKDAVIEYLQKAEKYRIIELVEFINSHLKDEGVKLISTKETETNIHSEYFTKLLKYNKSFGYGKEIHNINGTLEYINESIIFYENDIESLEFI